MDAQDEPSGQAIQLLLEAVPHFDGLTNESLAAMMSDYLGAGHDPMTTIVRLLIDYAMVRPDELSRARQETARHLRAAAAAVREARKSFLPFLERHKTPFDMDGLATIADDLDRRAVNMKPHTPPIVRGRGRPESKQFNCFVLIARIFFEQQTGEAARANYNKGNGEYDSPFIRYVEQYAAELNPAPGWPQGRRARGRQVKKVLDRLAGK
jgi:hypothetical protein